MKKNKKTMLQAGDRVFIMNGVDALQYVDLTTKKLHTYPSGTTDWKLPKWYLHPIEWFKWRKFIRKVNKIPPYDTYNLQKYSENPYGSSRVKLAEVDNDNSKNNH